MIGASGELGSSSARSRSRTCPVSTIRQASVRPPSRNSAMRSMGFCVAEMPMRTGGAAQSSDRRSSDSARWAPRLLPATAWISSTITVRTVPSISRPDSEVSRMYSDSGVVTRMCGGVRRIRARAVAGVSPVRTAVRICTGLSKSSRSRIPASGSSRFFWMSLDSAFRGET